MPVMSKEEFIEKIAQVKIVHDDKEKTEFSQFYRISKFPCSFDLQVSVVFLNLIPNKPYRLKVDILADTSPLQIIHSDVQYFSVSEKDMILLHDNLGQTFIETGIRLNILQENAHKIKFTLTDDRNVELSSFSNYYYFGGIDNV